MDFAPIAGRQLGEFVVRERIGGGGFGDVYLAEQPGLEREAVIKVLQTRRGADALTVQRFMREARLASKLDHPYAAHMYAFGAERDGMLWIAMELVRGTPLDKILVGQGALDLERYVPFLEQICEVLATAHEQGIVHRDIKPANVMVLSRAGRLLPKLLDFGLAKLIENTGAGGAVTVAAAVVPTAAFEAPPTDTLALGTTLSSEDGATLLISPDGSSPPADLATTGAIFTNTEAGSLLGTPAYMSPEQWRGTTLADARSDQYSLAILSYEALTARRPFLGETIDELRSAHLHQALPPFGVGYPAALDAVFARATAKNPEARYPAILDFARAVRTAAGLDAPVVTLPKLEERLREATIRDAPKPIAEAALALDAARNVHQARDAMWALVHAATRYVGVVALACRSRVGPGRDVDAPEVVDHLKALRRRELTDDEWIELARGLCAPFAARADAHPVPELVNLFTLHEGDGFAPLLLAQNEDRHHAGAGEDSVRAALVHGLPLVEDLLRRLAFLSEYQLVVARGDVLEQWMGARRVQRTMSPSGARLEEGRPALADWQGRPIVSLWPLVQVAPPVEGARGELFLLAGRRRHGALLIAPPYGFERDDDSVWDWFRSHILPDDVSSGPTARAEIAPYRGLAAFRAEDAALYFGRELEIVELGNRVRMTPLTCVVGPSGAGKSSLVQAGLVPALPSSWRVITLRPGATPIAALGARLDVDARTLAAELAADPSVLAQRLLARRDGGAAETTVLFVDQLEELFTLCLDGRERELFAQALAAAAANTESRVRVVCTLRDDFLVRAEQLPALRRKIGASMHVVTTPAPDDLRRILVEPARRAGYEFEDRALPDEMIAEIVDKPGALALLSFTAEQLWSLRDRHFGQLTRAAYHGMGGVGGALAAHAEAVLAGLPVEEQRLVREAFRHLVTAEGTRAVLSQNELVQVLGGGAGAEDVIEKLVAARLLAASEAPADDGRSDEQIEVIHEALLGAWPRLVTWRREDAEGARLRDQLRAAARQWDDRRRPRGLLWRDEALAELQLWRARGPRALTSTEDAFAAASLAEARRSRRLRRLATSVAFAALGLLAVVLYLLYRQAGVERLRAEDRAREAGQRVAQLYMEQGRQALLARDPMRALVYLDEALERGLATTATRFLVARADEVLRAQKNILAGNDDSVRAVAFSPDGKLVATGSADKTVRLFSSDQVQAKGLTLTHGQLVRTVVFAPDGKRLLSASNDGTAVIWELPSGRALATMRHPGQVSGALFVDGGAGVLTRCSDGTARLFDAATGDLIRSFVGHGQPIFSMAVDGVNGRLATGSADRSVIVWDLATGKKVARIADFKAAIMALAFSPDGRALVASSHQEELRMLDPESGRPILDLVGPREVVLSLSYAADGSKILTSGYDRVAHIWDARSGKLLVTLEGHDDTIAVSRFSHDGRRAVTGSADGTARVWDVATGKVLAIRVGHRDAILALDWSADETQIVTGSADRTARVWDARPDNVLAAFDLAEGPVTAAAWHDVGTFAVAAGDTVRRMSMAATDQVRTVMTGVRVAALAPTTNRSVVLGEGGARLVDEHGLAIATLEGNAGPVSAAAFSGNGLRLITSAGETTARVWDGATGKPVTALTRSAAALSAIALSADGTRAAIGAADGTVHLWVIGRAAPQATLVSSEIGEPVRSVAFSADGRRLVSASAGGARVWDAGQGTLVASLGQPKVAVRSASLGPDGALAVTGGEDGAVRVFEAQTGKLLLVLDRFAAVVTVVAVSDDGARLLAGDAAGAVRVFGIAADERSAVAIAQDVRCSVPLRLDGDLIVPVDEKGRDPSCGAP